MKTIRMAAQRFAWWCRAFALVATLAAVGHSARAASEDLHCLARLVGVENAVRLMVAGSSRWLDLAPGSTNGLFANDQLSTATNSRARLILLDGMPVTIGELTVVRFKAREDGAGIRLLRGIAAFFNRDRPNRYEIEVHGVNMVVRGTEFAVEVRDATTASFTLFEGEVEMRDAAGQVSAFHSGDVVTLSPSAPPRRTAVVKFGDWSAVQWALYYPAILNPADLGWAAAPAADLDASWRFYQRGNLPQALAAYPSGREPASPQERLFLAALLLSAGNVSEAERWLASIGDTPQLAPLAAAHHRLIAAVQRGAQSGLPKPPPAPAAEDSATVLLAESYSLQIEGRLAEARVRARAATERAPQFGLAWVRLAELEFSFGEVRAAERALEQGIKTAPENAEAHALRGFLLAAHNRLHEAQQAFQSALELDPALGNAWLGRGLCRIRRGDLEGGRADLLLAAAAEPQRAVLRSYLAKALLDAKPFRPAPFARKATKELDLARELDPRDPTPWLYSALLNLQENRINDAVGDLERSVELNTNRFVYRSSLLLDQDRAVRGANLANVYADAGMTDVSLREATRALNADYANASAHLFLANSYDALRDPRQVNLRFEAPWFSEFLLANLLAPVGAGTLSQTVSQGEYSKLFERDGLGVVSDTLWTGNGDWTESGALFGHFGNFEYALDAMYRSEVGQRPNNDLDQLTLSFKAKYQLGPSDTVYLQGIYYDAESGDVAQYYDPALANPTLRLHETQEPIVLAGWHHEWKPGVHTLLLVSPWNTRATLTDPLNHALLGGVRSDGSVFLVPAQYLDPVPLDYSTRYTGWSAELQQLWQVKAHTLIGGVRYQSGEFDTAAMMDVAYVYDFDPGESTWRSYGASPDMERVAAYAYDQWRLLPWALLSAGVSYDRLEEPVNFTVAPLTGDEQTLDQVSPKVGLTLTPWKGGTVRGAYTRSLGGVSFDQSYRLEPVQVAGFTQTYRGLMPESLLGLVPGQDVEIWGVALEQQLPTHSYLAISAQQAHSEADRGVGAFLWDPKARATLPTTLTESLAFQERTLVATANQLVGEYVALGAAYRLSEAELDSALVRVTHDGAREQRSVLQQLDLRARFNHPSGFFARWDSIWTRQSNHDDVSALPGDDFWQHNVWMGWRFHRRQAELAVGVLNLTDQDYQLYPLNWYPETYRSRTFAVSGRFSF